MTNEEMLMRIERGISNYMPQVRLRFEVHVTEHCNLNCKHCAHFSPLAEESYIDIDRYTKDVNRLSELFDGEMSYILLLGGEPLLHPRLSELMEITRKAFPIGRIRIVTNGILLPKMENDFWEACKKNNVEISPSEYPINFDYDGWEKKIEAKGVKYTTYSPARKTMYKLYPIFPNRAVGGGDISCRSNFFHCHDATRCVTLRDGRMYTCDIAAHALHLKKHFNLDITLSKRDSVDIYDVKSGAELLKKLARPIPFCQYCDVTVGESLIECEWEVSHKDRFEWLGFEGSKDDIAYLKEKKLDIYVFGAGHWGSRIVHQLHNEGIEVKAIIATRNAQKKEPICGVPVVNLSDIGNIRKESICLVALLSPAMKAEVYPLLSRIGFGDVVPIS